MAIGRSSHLALVRRVLETVGIPLSKQEIWEHATKLGYDKEIGARGKTPWQSIVAQIYLDIRDNPGTDFVKASSRPTRFSLRSREHSLTPVAQPAAGPKRGAKTDYTELDLHPYLVHFAYHKLQAHCKTIQHLRTTRNQSAEWLHPDIVGCFFPLQERRPAVSEFSSVLGSTPVKLFSFEVKRSLDMGNLRESFFQTVSNSSWAHEGYLAAVEISEKDEFRSEVRRLSGSFGIGVIKIDIVNPHSSEIVCPARMKDYVDWDAINKLAHNADFEEFLQRVINDLKTKEIRKEWYDSLIDSGELARRAGRWISQPSSATTSGTP